MSRASSALVSTPSKAISSLTSTLSKPATPTTEIPPSPGTFRHPQLTEILKRQSASSLTNQKIQTVIFNVIAIVLTFVLGGTIREIIGKFFTLISLPPSTVNASTIIQLLRLLFFTNSILCLRPVIPYISRKDNITDIPLTPSQRVLLGLPASNQGSPAPSAGSVGYVTPPRYRRDGGMNASTPTPNSPLSFSTGRRSISANYATSSLSSNRQASGPSPNSQHAGPQSARTYRPMSDSPFPGSPSGSPLFYKAVNNDFGASTPSLGYSLSRSQSLRERQGGFEGLDNVPGTPSPSGPKRVAGVNYKWLYDKGARLPRSESTAF